MRLVIIAVLFSLSGFAVNAASLDTSAGKVTVTRVLNNIKQPWGLALIPGGGFFVTEREGQLIYVDAGGKVTRVRGTPPVVSAGQGGLLDVMVPRDFAQSREVFLSYSKRQGSGAGTALAVGVLSQNGQRLTNLRTIFEMTPGSSEKRHFGSRVIEALDGTIFVTIGDRGHRDTAQDLSLHNGSVIRINRDGSVPADNPFVGQPGFQPEIWSYGHRNPQGATLDSQGNLWINEHGPMGGDEVNRITRGSNFGWPQIGYGRHYNGSQVGVGYSSAGMEQPAYFWDPSIAPSGLMIYSGKLWPQWKGSVFSGSLKFHYLSRLDPGNGWKEEKIQSNLTRRLRQVVEAPDGSIWFLSIGKQAVFRMTPG